MSFTLDDNESFRRTGTDMLEEQKKHIETDLGQFLLPNNSLNGTKIQENWFPQIQADIFLSHSHKDEKTALVLSGWLYQKFRLRTFIDSAVWGYSNNLLKIIDDEYCLQEDTSSYSYEKRNFTTSHVHLMLCVALNKMIDNCECIFFLNTPNSISSNVDKEMTASPWIYTELSITQTIQKRTPKRIELKTKTFSRGENLNEHTLVEYELELSHLKELTFETLKTLGQQDFYSPESVLDALYSNIPISNKFLK